MSKILQLITLLAALAAFTGCKNRNESEPRARLGNPAVISDSAATRKQLAEQIIKLYPRDEFGDDLSKELDRIVGSQVLSEARVKFKERVSDASFEAKRVQSLSERFTTAELNSLIQLLQTPDGKSAFRKLPAYWRGWNEQVMPVVYEVLTNAVVSTPSASRPPAR